MMLTARGLCFLALLALVPGSIPAADDSSWRVEVGKAGKAATALVEVKARNSSGSAFCIHPSGLFLTNTHVVQAINFPPNMRLPPADIRLVLNPGQKTEKAYTARVIRSDRDQDLALLRIEGVKDLPALTLGSDVKLTELEEVVACGFPFGAFLTPGRQESPAVSINAGSVTSLRHKDGRLHRIQLDAALNPGNSGGPVLDRSGKIIGMVVSGVQGGTGVNFAIPVSVLAGFVARPDIEFNPPPLDAANLYTPVAFEARVVPIIPAAAPLTVELSLKPARGGKERTFRMEGAEGKYRASAVPLEPPPGPLTLRLLARFDNGTLNATLTDRAIKVGDREVKLSEVRSVQIEPGSALQLRDGSRIDGPLSGLDAVPVLLGGQTLTVDLRKAESLEVAPAADVNMLWYTLVVREGQKEILRQSESLFIRGLVPAPAARTGSASIIPPTLEGNRVERTLGERVTDVAVGGGGRYLVLHLPRQRKLAIFDVNVAKVVGHIPINGDGARFTAGLEDVLVVLPATGTIERWSLKTLERDVAATVPLKGTLKGVAMGSASHGPLLIYTGAGNEPLERPSFALVNPTTMRPMINELNLGNAAHMHVTGNTTLHIRASANGRLFGLWCTNQSPTGMGVILYADPLTTMYYAHNSFGHVVPGPDGRILFTRFGRYAPPLQLIEQVGSPNPILPACHGDQYLSLPPPGKGSAVTVRAPGKDQPITTLTDVGLPDAVEDNITHDFTLDKRVHLIPEARLIITIPTSNDRLVLHRLVSLK
jgi:hypothetical protein